MAKRRSKQKGGPGRLRRTVFCPECETMMRYAKTKPHQWDRDDLGALIKVTRVFYWCEKCHTVIHFKYREDGKRGDLSRKLELQKEFGIRPQGLGGKFGSIMEI